MLGIPTYFLMGNDEHSANVLKAAKKAGLSGAIAEPLWRLLIEKSIEHEYEVFDKKSAAE